MHIHMFICICMYILYVIVLCKLHTTCIGIIVVATRTAFKIGRHTVQYIISVVKLQLNYVITT